MTDQRYLSVDPATHVKLVGGEGASSRTGLKNGQVNALFRQAQNSHNKERNNAIIQVLLQTGMRLSECAALTFEDITLGERSGLNEEMPLYQALPKGRASWQIQL
jgi:site-specific recombinase XerD